MFIKSLSVLLLVAGTFSWASGLDGKSAYRAPGASYLAYKSYARMMARQQLPAQLSPEEVAEPFGTAILPAATVWESEAVMLERFKKFRDHRFFNHNSRPNFLRRSSWLYPDDGCFARAGLAIRHLAQWANPVPNKIFVFGDLKVLTKNSPFGSVTWWYHVAPLVEVNGQKYVLDPSIEANGPLRLEDWLARMSNNPQGLEVAVCGSGSYTPYDVCARNTDGIESMAMSDQGYFLGAEWYRLEELSRDPEKELGDFPPWLDQVGNILGFKEPANTP